MLECELERQACQSASAPEATPVVCARSDPTGRKLIPYASVVVGSVGHLRERVDEAVDVAKVSEDSDADAEADANVGAGGPRGRRGGGRRGDLDLGVALVAEAGRAATTHRRRVLVGDDKGDPPPSGLPEPVPPTLAPASTLLSSSRTLTSLPCLSLPQAVRRRTRVAVDVAKASEDSDT